MSGILKKRGNLETDMHREKIPCENEGRDQGEGSTCQGASKVASKPPEATGQRGSRFYLTIQRRNQP